MSRCLVGYVCVLVRWSVCLFECEVHALFSLPPSPPASPSLREHRVAFDLRCHRELTDRRTNAAYSHTSQALVCRGELECLPTSQFWRTE